MKKITAKALTAVILSALFLLPLCTVANADEGTESETRPVQLSNLKLSGSPKTKEEKKVFDEMQELVSSAEYEKGNNILHITNTTDFDDEIGFIIVYYDRDGTCVGSSMTTIDEWKPGEEAKLTFNSIYNPYQTAELALNFPVGNTWFRTEYEPLRFTDMGNVDLECKTKLPSVFDSGNAKYIFTGFEFYPLIPQSGVINCVLKIYLTKESGHNEYADYIYYKIRDKNGTVFYSDMDMLYGMTEGENCVLTDPYINLEPGEYYLEVYGN